MYLSATAGAFTQTAPAAAHKLVIGIVTAKDAAAGSIRFQLSKLWHESLAATNVAQTWNAVQLFNYGQFKLNDVSDDHKVLVQPSEESADRTLTIPVLGGNKTLAMIDLAQTFSAAQAFNASVVIGATAPVTGSNVLKLESGTAWTQTTDAIGAWVADNVAGDARLQILSEIGTIPASIGNGIVATGTGAGAIGTALTASTGLIMRYTTTYDAGLIECAAYGTAYKALLLNAAAFQFYVAETTRLQLNGNGLCIGATVLATGANVLKLELGTAHTPVADAASCWVADRAVGDARWNFKGEGSGNPVIIGNGYITVDKIITALSGGGATLANLAGSGILSGERGVGIGYDISADYGFLGCVNTGTAWKAMTYYCGEHTFYLGGSGNKILELTSGGNTVVGNQAALATTATDGFLYVPSCAGVPTGVPTAYTGKIAIVADSTNNRLYIYSGGAWVALN